MSRFEGRFTIPTPMLCQANAIEQCATFCEQLGIKSPLWVTDSGLKDFPALLSQHQTLLDAGFQSAIFSQCPSNPDTLCVEQGVQAFHAGTHDGIIALGGGSAMDCAKAIALMQKQTAPIQSFVDEGDNWQQVKTPLCPIIAVPTTAGTGSEVGRCAVIVDKVLEQKLILFHPELLPKQVLLDPMLTVSLPPHLTAFTGMDALSHNLEALCVDSYHPIADAIAIHGIELVAHFLPTAFKQPQNIEARTQMLLASSMGATAFQKGLGGMHTLSHALGGLYGLHHGMLNAILMPYVLVFNQTYIDQKCANLAHKLKLSKASFTGFLDWVLALREQLAIPHDLSQLDVPFNLDKIIEKGLVDPTRPTNPRPLEANDLEHIFSRACQGVI